MEKFTLNQQENKNPNPEGIEKHKGFIDNIKSRINNLTGFSLAGGIFAGSGFTFIGEAIAENNMGKAAVGVGAGIASLFTFIGAATGREEIKKDIEERAQVWGDEEITNVHLN